MTFAPFFDRLFKQQPVMGVFRGQGVARTLDLCATVWDAGVGVVEITLGTPEDLSSLSAAVDAGRRRGRPVGAGTVTTIGQLDAAQSAGASFTVAPGLDRTIVQESIRRSLPHIPGVATATEVQTALAFGLTWLKVFPVTTLDPSWARHIRGPFPNARFLGTGGVTFDTLDQYLTGGMDVVGMGAALAEPDQRGRLEDLLERSS